METDLWKAKEVKIARKGVTAEEVAEKDAAPEEKVIATNTAEKAMEAEMKEKGEKSGTTLIVSVKMKTNKVLT
jgi:hypothetical protein